jgi:hypothetical protein
MNNRHVRARAKQVQGALRRGVPSSDHGHILIPVRVRLGEVMRHVRQIFSVHTQKIWMVVESRRYHNFLAVILMRLPLRIGGMHYKRPIVAAESLHPLVLPHFNPEVLHSPPVIFQRLGPRRLAAGDGHRQRANLHALRRREEVHVHRIVKQRIAQAAFVNHQRAQPFDFRFNRRRETRRPRANADNVVSCVHGHSVRWDAAEFNSIA